MAIEEKIAHLGFIQGVINRMGGNSFLIKGWVTTLVAATFALSAENSNAKFVYIAFFPLAFFWWLDAFSCIKKNYIENYMKKWQTILNQVLNFPWMPISTRRRWIVSS